MDFDTVINSLLKDFPIDDEVKLPLILAYKIKMSQIMLEIIIGANIQNQESLVKISTFLQTEFTNLSPEIKGQAQTYLAD